MIDPRDFDAPEELQSDDHSWMDLYLPPEGNLDRSDLTKGFVAAVCCAGVGVFVVTVVIMWAVR